MAKARFYELDDLVAVEHQFSGQAALIVKTMLDKHPITAKQITDTIKSRLTTRQDPLRVVSFYLSTWKKSGLVRVVDGVEPDGEVQTVSRDDVGTISAAQLAGTPQAANPVGSEVDFDYVKSPLDDALREILDIDGASTPKEVSEHLQLLGRTVTAKQCSDKLRKMLDKKQVVRNDEGAYDLVDATERMSR